MNDQEDDLIYINNKCLRMKKIINKNILISVKKIKKYLINPNKFNSKKDEIKDIINTYNKSLNVYSFLSFTILLLSHYNKEYYLSVFEELLNLEKEYFNITKKIPFYVEDSSKYISLIINQITLLVMDNEGA